MMQSKRYQVNAHQHVIKSNLCCALGKMNKVKVAGWSTVTKFAFCARTTGTHQLICIHCCICGEFNWLVLHKVGPISQDWKGQRKRSNTNTIHKQDGCRCFLTVWQDQPSVLSRPTIVEKYNHGMQDTDDFY